MHSEICGNSMQVTVLSDAMKDDALNDRVTWSASLEERQYWTQHRSFLITLGIGYVLLVYDDYEDDEL